MSPSLPQRTNFSASLTVFPISVMSLWVFSAHGCDGNIAKYMTNMKLSSPGQFTLTHLLHTFMNVLIDEGQSEQQLQPWSRSEISLPLEGSHHHIWAVLKTYCYYRRVSQLQLTSKLSAVPLLPM